MIGQLGRLLLWWSMESGVDQDADLEQRVAAVIAHVDSIESRVRQLEQEPLQKRRDENRDRT